MRWAVVGANGMLGSDLLAELETQGREAVGLTRENFDLAAPEGALAAELERLVGRESVIFNCAAYTKVDLAESEPELAMHVNATLAGSLARAAAAIGARLIHVSTDYVFDGRASEPYDTDSPVNPLSVYGKSKLAGEREVMAASADHRVVRTAWLYGPNGPSFARTMMRKFAAGESVRVVSDQIGAPTFTGDLAKFLVALAESESASVAAAQADAVLGHGTPSAQRVLHAASSGQTSWHGFALEIAQSMGADPSLVSAIGTEDYPTPAARPRYSVLAASRISGFEMPDWRTAWRQAYPALRKAG
jgi:dTDP-4-dehydrorhamnose reductase